MYFSLQHSINNDSGTNKFPIESKPAAISQGCNSEDVALSKHLHLV
jgi:hypothetical protein